MKIFNLFKYYYNYLLILIGLGIVSWILWARFIRPRVPKDIPLALTEKGFYILVYICIIYFYMVYKLIRPGQSNEFIVSIVELLFTPLKALDEYVKNSKYIKPTYLKLVDKVVEFIQSYDCEADQNPIIKKIYMRFYIIPRVILVSILCMDIFYIHTLALIYKVILLGILPLCLRYVKYSVKYIKDQYIKDLDSQYSFISLDDKNYCDPNWEYDSKTMPYHDKEVSVEEYIRIQLELKESDNYSRRKYYPWRTTEDDQEDKVTLGYDAYPISKEHIYIQYLKDKYNDPNTKLTDEDNKILRSKFFKEIPIILNMIEFLKNYAEVDYIFLIRKFRYILIKHVKIIIFSLYLICWSYILITSLPFLPMNAFQWLWVIQNLENPFSLTNCPSILNEIIREIYTDE